MEIVNDIRYWLGVVLLSSWVPAIFCWIIIHPLINLWRRTGKAVMWTVIIIIAFSGVYILYTFREFLMGADLGFSFWLLIPALLLAGFGTWLDLIRRKHLTTRILTGNPEIEGDASNLLTKGPYAHVRHPRYIAITVAYFGYATFSNYAGLYLYLLASLPLLYLIVILEEKELKERFGKAYEDYAGGTPRFIPKGSYDFFV